ncbi:protein kinase domain-containing protein [Sphingomonas sp.]|uniref:protein kinase domain-containing protein n=1 Tax=Sphingomonas sp. TaxID=28214 RepID=UPI002DE7AE6B|nr:tetratricopeptide repeat protein [Sphingomonas sp.]
MSRRGIRSTIGGIDVARAQRRRRQLINFDEGLVAHVLETRRGGMGVVHLCSLEEGALEPTFALKTFEESYFFDPGMQAAVEAEASCWLEVSGAPFVLPLIDVLNAHGKPHLMMPAVRSPDRGDPSLAGEIARSGAGLESHRCMTLSLQIATAMAGCDRLLPGIVHGDLKPGNVLLLPDGTAQVADFGAARLLSHAGPSNLAQGTALYLAPECWDDPEVASPASDVYAFGATLCEMLTGRPPFDPRPGGGLELAAMHRTSPPICVTREAEPLARALSDLATRCLAKRPEDRPSSMTMVQRMLHSICNELDPVLLLTSLAPGVARHDVLGDVRLLTVRARSLLERGDGQGALRVLSRIPADQMAGDLLRLRGTALCLAGREEEALVDLEAFLVDAPEGDERTRGANEMALAYKRLGRLEDARAVYEALIPAASSEMQLMLRGNYAATLLEQGSTGRAVNILRELTSRQSDSPEAWAILADALSRGGQSKEAVAAMQRAVQLAPRNGAYRVFLGGLLMDGLRDVGSAIESLDAAYGLGHQSPEWLVRTLACNMLLDRREHVLELLGVLRDGLPSDEAEALFQEAVSLASSVAGQKEGAALSAVVEEDEVSNDRTAEMVGEEASGLGDDGSRAADQRSDADRKEYSAAVRKGLVPHVQARYSSVDGSTLFDFYYAFDAADYPEVFAQAAAEISVHSMGLMGGASTRSRPFVFARCPVCSANMLTQRDDGECYRCQGCEERVRMTPVADQKLDRLMARTMEAARINSREIGAGTVFLAVFGSAARDQSAVVELEEAGYVPVPPEAVISRRLMMEAVQSGVPSPSEMRVWMRPVEPGWSIALDGTPTEVNQLVRRLRRRIGQLSSMSMLVPPEAVSDMLVDEQQVVHRLIEADGGDDPAVTRTLIEAALRHGRTEDACRLLGSLRLSSPDDPDTFAAAAAVGMAQDRPEDAVALLEEVLRQRPRDQGARMLLASACLNTGRVERFRELRDQLRAHGLPGAFDLELSDED